MRFSRGFNVSAMVVVDDKISLLACLLYMRSPSTLVRPWVGVLFSASLVGVASFFTLDVLASFFYSLIGSRLTGWRRVLFQGLSLVHE